MATTKIVIEDGASAPLQKISNEAEKTDASVVSLRKQMKELNIQMQNLDPNTEEFQKAAQKLGELKDKMADVGEAVKAQTGPAIEGMNNGFGIMKDQIANLDFEGLGQSLTGMAGNIKKISFKTFTDGIKSMITGLKNLTASMMSNPVTLLFVILAATIALVVTNWKEFASLFKGERAAEASLQKELGLLNAQNAALQNKIAYSKIYGDSMYKQYLLSQELLATEIKQEQVKMRLAEIADDEDKKNEARLKRDELRTKMLQDQTQHVVDYYGIVMEAGRLGDKQKQQDHEKNEAAKKYNSALEETRAKLIELRADQSKTFSGVGNAYDIRVYEDNEKQLLNAIDETNAEIDKKNREAEKAKAEQRQAALDTRLAFERELKNAILKENSTQYEYELEILDQNYKDKLKAAKKNGADLELVEKWYMEQIMLVQEAQYERERQLEIQAAERKKALRQYELNAQLDYANETEAIEEAIYQARLSPMDKELDAVRTHYFELKTEAEARGLDITALVEAEEAESKAIRDKYAEEKKAKDKKELDDAKALAKAKHDAQIEWAEKGAVALQTLGDAVFATQLNNVVKGSKEEENLRRKQFKFNKALQLGGAIIDTAKAAVASLALSPIAVGTVPNPAGIASLALVGITGAATIAKIAATQFDGGGGGAAATPSTSGGGGAGSTPPIDMSFLRNRPDQQQPPFQAYVVSGQVASSMEAQQLIKNQSRL